jgi:hypothetical protein
MPLHHALNLFFSGGEGKRKKLVRSPEKIVRSIDMAEIAEDNNTQVTEM